MPPPDGSTWTGGGKLQAHLAQAREKLSGAKRVRVGFLEKATYPDGQKVATIAAIQEFGAPARGIPPRPFFRPMIAEVKPKLGAALAALLKANDGDAHKTLGQIGVVLEGKLRDSIIKLTAPPLSPVTLLLRDRFWTKPDEITFKDVQKARQDVASGTKPEAQGTQAKPLVWTGHMLNSISSEVEE